jgi:hypothetical protein
MSREKIVIFIILSVLVVAVNSSVNFFDPLQGGFGEYATSVGTSTTFFWACVLVAIDSIYIIMSFRMFDKMEKKSQ